MTPIEARRELSALHSTNLVFTEAQCRRDNQLIDVINEAKMVHAPYRIGPVTEVLMSEADMIEQRFRRMQDEKGAAERQKAAFLILLAEALRPVIREEIERAMATKSIGRTKVTTTKTGKVKVSPILTAPKTARIAKAKKADRTVKALKSNASKSKAATKKAG